METNNPHDIPCGPLTRADFDSLSNSFYDASQVDLHRVAGERGLIGGESTQLAFHEKLVARRAELPDDSSQARVIDGMLQAYENNKTR